MIRSRLLGVQNPSLKQFHRRIKFFDRKEDKPKEEPVINQTAEIESPEVAKEVSQAVKDFQNRSLKFLPPMVPVRQAWVENLDTLDSNNLGLIDLHPEVFGARPRTDLIYLNYHWQRMYKYINFEHVPWKHEIQRSLRKPWPQLRSGRAHHGTKRDPRFLGGVKTFGPHGPETHFYMLPFVTRLHGLTSMLSIKLAQDDLHIVNNLELPSSDPQYLHDLMDHRKWGPSILFVDVSSIMPKNISLATLQIKHLNLMPVHGLNVHSMLKHDTLVLTLDAVERIEERLIHHLHSTQRHMKTNNHFTLNWQEQNYA